MKLIFKLKVVLVAAALFCGASLATGSVSVYAEKEGINLYDNFADEDVVDEKGNPIRLIFVVSSPDEIMGKVYNKFYLSENKDGQQFDNFDEVVLRFFDENENLVYESGWNKVETDFLRLKTCEFYLDLNRLQEGQVYTIKIFGKDAAGSESFVGRRRFCKKNIQEYRNDLIKHNEENNKVDPARIEDYIVNKYGKTVSDRVNVCYVDFFDGDARGVVFVSLQSNNNGRFHDSVFFGHDNIRVEFFDESGKLVLTKNAVCKRNKLVDHHQSNDFKINKFELEFGKNYNLKFYDENKPSNDENLIGTFKLQLATPYKSSNLNDFHFIIEAEDVDDSNSLNVCLGSTNRRITDRLRFTFGWSPNSSGRSDKVKVECLSNSNDVDSVFKDCESLIVDVVDENGNVVLSKTTEPAQNFEGLNVIKSKMFKVEPGELVFDEKYTLKFYDGNDKQKLRLLAHYPCLLKSYGYSGGSEFVVE